MNAIAVGSIQQLGQAMGPGQSGAAQQVLNPFAEASFGYSLAGELENQSNLSKARSKILEFLSAQVALELYKNDPLADAIWRTGIRAMIKSIVEYGK